MCSFRFLFNQAENISQDLKLFSFHTTKGILQENLSKYPF